MELDKFQRSDSLCYTSPQTSVLTLLKDRATEEFENVLKKNVDKKVDVNYLYEDPDNKTLLDIACSSKKNAKFVELLLAYGANVNSINKLHKKAPIHFAVEYSDYDTLKLLVEHRGTDMNLTDRSGNTALHLAALHGKTDFVQLLLKQPAVNVNKTNRKSQTPLHIALSKDHRNIVEIFLQSVDVDLDDICDIDDQTCRSLISSKYPDFELSKTGSGAKNDENLFGLLYNRNHEAFAAKAKSEKVDLDENDGENTYLQYACKFGLEAFVTTLLNCGADPNACFVNNERPPIMIAAYYGYYNIVRLLVDTRNVAYDPVAGENALHAVLNGVMTCRKSCDDVRELGTNEQAQNHYKCLEYLLDNVPCHSLDVNLPDKKGNTVLHYAFKADDADIIHLLLDRGSYVGHKNFSGEMPVKFMKAETLQHFLDDSITTNDSMVGAEDYEIVFKYNLLAPPKQYSLQNGKPDYSAESGVVDEYEMVSETEPLVVMSEVSELRPLLKHPLFTTFLNLKWYTMRKYFYVNVAFYLTFWSLLTVYVLFVYGPETSVAASQNSTNRAAADDAPGDQNGSWLWCATLFFACVLFFREFFQFSVSTGRYVSSPENWIEAALIVTTHVILLCDIGSPEKRSQLAAVAIFLSWMELVLLIGRHPLVSTYVEMFKVVTLNFLKFLAWYSVLILAFALSFYLLFKDSPTFPFFHDPALAVFKSAVMSTGEFDSSNIPFGDKVGTNHILFVLFVFLVSIVLFNLLNGLAVSDTQAIRADAELVGIISRAKLITYIETMAIGDPFSYLSVLDKFSCFCCCVPVTRRSEGCRKHSRVFYDRINLFPTLFPDGEVRVRVNENNRVVMPNTNLSKIEADGLSNCYGLHKWRIDQAIVKKTKLVLAARSSTAESADQKQMSQALTRLHELYDFRLNQVENISTNFEERLKNVEDCSNRIDQKLTDLMNALKQKITVK